MPFNLPVISRGVLTNFWHEEPSWKWKYREIPMAKRAAEAEMTLRITIRALLTRTISMETKLS